MTLATQSVSSITARWTMLLLATVVTPVTIAASSLNVVGWGDDSYGEIDVPSNLTNAVIVDASSGFNVALLDNGTVRYWGGNGYPPPGGLSGVQSISYRFDLGFVLFSNGTVSAWGD